VALVPVLIGAGAGMDLTQSLAHGYRTAMVVIGLLCAAAAIVAALFVSDERATAPRFVPPAPDHGCVVPVRGAEAAG
jgi:hypothetical protein